jgi:hypothetical protein
MKSSRQAIIQSRKPGYVRCVNRDRFSISLNLEQQTATLAGRGMRGIQER